ncbi:hypothetical protein ACFP3I_12825 [Chryseobacterium arachidis]|uniref:hypothetical protein n=1 Tax=Chryseobacterium arachidis TaxID=1416778 RepID=UPI0036241188
MKLFPAIHYIFFVTAPLRSAATKKDAVSIGARVAVIYSRKKDSHKVCLSAGNLNVNLSILYFNTTFRLRKDKLD